MHRKIDMYRKEAGEGLRYLASTNHFRTCSEARAYAARTWGLDMDQVRAYFDRSAA